MFSGLVFPTSDLPDHSMGGAVSKWELSAQKLIKYRAENAIKTTNDMRVSVQNSVAVFIINIKFQIDFLSVFIVFFSIMNYFTFIINFYLPKCINISFFGVSSFMVQTCSIHFQCCHQLRGYIGQVILGNAGIVTPVEREEEK